MTTEEDIKRRRRFFSNSDKHFGCDEMRLLDEIVNLRTALQKVQFWDGPLPDGLRQMVREALEGKPCTHT